MIRTSRRQHHRSTRILLAPLLAVVFLVGWVLYYIGNTGQKQPRKLTKITPKNDENFELLMIPKEEEQTITN